MDHIRVPFIT